METGLTRHTTEESTLKRIRDRVFDRFSLIAVIKAAGSAGINIIPLAWTLLLDSSQTFQNTAVPKINAVTKVRRSTIGMLNPVLNIRA